MRSFFFEYASSRVRRGQYGHWRRIRGDRRKTFSNTDVLCFAVRLATDRSQSISNFKPGRGCPISAHRCEAVTTADMSTRYRSICCSPYRTAVASRPSIHSRLSRAGRNDRIAAGVPVRAAALPAMGSETDATSTNLGPGQTKNRR
jgi:hypothetical protein